VFGLAIDDCQGGTVTGLGVSIGVAIWPEIDEVTLEGVLAAADSALYEAKRLGRDQVQLAGAHRRLRWSPSARTSHAADQRPPRRLDPARGHA
jgi:predicted signal transduction protein with EAL and GGDEF domain